MREDRHEQILQMKPQFPKFIYPIQKCNDWGTTPPSIPNFYHKEMYTSMLWILTGMLTRVEEMWTYTTKVLLQQSKWHGWILTYIGKKCFFIITELQKVTHSDYH